MNTHITHQISDSAGNLESVPKSTTGTPKIRHRIAVFLAAAIVLTTGLGAASAAPAAAVAIPTYGTAIVCFKAPSVVGWGTYDRPVFVDAWIDGSWQQIGNAIYPDRYGCIRQALVAGYYWHYRVYRYERGAGTYVGTSNWAFVNTGGFYNLGTVWLSLIRG
jgi:hypothetical protein